MRIRIDGELFWHPSEGFSKHVRPRAGDNWEYVGHTAPKEGGWSAVRDRRGRGRGASADGATYSTVDAAIGALQRWWDGLAATRSEAGES